MLTINVRGNRICQEEYIQEVAWSLELYRASLTGMLVVRRMMFQP